MSAVETRTQREVMQPMDVWGKAYDVFRKGKKTIFANDFDGTLSYTGESNGVNPFDTKLHPIAAVALKRLQSLDQPIGVISNRSTLQIARIYADAEIVPDIIFGSYGYVIAVPDATEESGYKRTVDESLLKHKSTINTVQNALRKCLMDFALTGNVDLEAVQAEETINTKYGIIYIENKDIINGFEYGIAADYNMNNIPSSARQEIVSKMNEAVANALNELNLPEENLVEFQKLWGIHADSNHPEQEGNYTFKTRPLATIGKGKAIVNLLRELFNKSDGNIGLCIYGGDYPPDDKAAMRADKLVERFTDGRIQTVGILVNQNPSSESQIRYSDLRMDNVGKYSGFLLTLSNILSYAHDSLGIKN